MLSVKQKSWYALLITACLSACTAYAPIEHSSAENSAETSSEMLNMQRKMTAEQSISQDEKLGTQWGDEVQSVVKTVNLRRISQQSLDENVLRYAAKDFSGHKLNAISLVAGKISFSVQDDQGRGLPLFRDKGAYYLSGKEGQAYQLSYQNHSDQTFEIVASVDGLDVIRGVPASRAHSGYVLKPQSRLVIEGFRKSDSAVASFIFSAAKSAYAANNEQGDARHIGLIGTAIFELHDPNAGQANPFPADNGYAKAPR